jgi:glycerol-3-phosphate dehydrogenase
VWSLAENDAALRERIVPDRPWLFAELRRGVTHEAALTLGDLLIRRIPLAFETADHGHAAARRVAPLVAEWLGWNEKDTRAALDAFDAEAARMFTVEPSPG